ncbi:MAG: F0F1 ATP synthase subunit alpha, partial [Acidipropionibacterium jensenii]|nr:F0F1 ATP synthase subunit alpha [Acidipropionibacterium jensenii]
AQYRDMQAFAMFASDLDDTSRSQLDRGARLMELLKQGQFSPYPIENQVISVWAGTTGKLDNVPVDDVLRFEHDMLDYLANNTEVLTGIRETGTFPDDSQKTAAAAIEKVKESFKTSEGKYLAGHEEFEPMDRDEIDQAKIVRAKRG